MVDVILGLQIISVSLGFTLLYTCILFIVVRFLIKFLVFKAFHD